MKLDKRITIISDIYSVNDGCHNWKFMNSSGYFANNITDFQDLSKCTYGKYDGYREQDKCFSCIVDLSSGAYVSDWFTYFIPENDLKPKEPEKKYRPFTLDEFTKKFSLGDEIIVRRKDAISKFRHKLFTEYTEDETKGIHLGSYWFAFEELFDEYELYTGTEWKPFGIEE